MFQIFFDIICLSKTLIPCFFHKKGYSYKTFLIFCHSYTRSQKNEESQIKLRVFFCTSFSVLFSFHNNLDIRVHKALLMRELRSNINIKYNWVLGGLHALYFFSHASPFISVLNQSKKFNFIIFLFFSCWIFWFKSLCSFTVFITAHENSKALDIISKII